MIISKQLLLASCLIMTVGICRETYGSYPLIKGKYAGIVKHHADVLLKHARDMYGSIHSPLFMDTISPQTLEPYVWTIDPNERVVKEFGQPAKQIMANFLFMQNILDMLRELTKLTGDEKYVEAARESADFALQNCVSSSGLIHWGKHATYDTLSDRRLGHPGTPGFHYFTGGGFASWEFLYSVNPQAVNRHIEQQWNTTIDSPAKWRRLEWSLHPQYTRSYGNPWKYVHEIDADVKVPFPTKHKMYPQIAFELLYAARVYSQQPNNDPRSWDIGSIFFKRFQDCRNPETGLWPPMYSYLADPEAEKKWFGSKVRESMGIPFFAKLAEITRDQEDGEQFLYFTLRDLRAYREYKQVSGTDQCYTNVSPDGKHAEARSKIPDSILWAFALIYRMTGERYLWDAIRDIVKGRGFGDIGEPDGSNIALNFDSDIDLAIDAKGKDNRLFAF